MRKAIENMQGDLDVRFTQLQHRYCSIKMGGQLYAPAVLSLIPFNRRLSYSHSQTGRGLCTEQRTVGKSDIRRDCGKQIVVAGWSILITGNYIRNKLHAYKYI